ncbi:hypothetical protein GALMADRAFT_85687 [Galerina marginata CBS 339.88]|uniref:Uncharacterized protein n=1 Tax=Galerina marginata (strain CBS 339.88) TaxID=685588 RepID=A0A067TJW8_GALM3|nr:hypothetical protein GALMADRAFT_85687 [Galerina marginata CBS 339.88]
MSFTNINDPAGVAALLEQLKSSTAWQELTAATSSNSTPEVKVPTPTPASTSSLQPAASSDAGQFTGPIDDISNILPLTGSTVASLLSQLQPFSTGPDPCTTSIDFGLEYGEFQNNDPVVNIPPFVSGRTEPAGDRRNFTFRQSLPVLSEQADDAPFVATIQKIKTDQDELERRLWIDREAIYTKYHEKVKIANTKAQMIGAVVSQHELNMITDAFKKEIFKFDHERAIPAWDGLVSRQQLELAQIKVPTMFVTSDLKDRERQQHVIKVLETILGPKAP